MVIGGTTSKTSMEFFNSDDNVWHTDKLPIGRHSACSIAFNLSLTLVIGGMSEDRSCLDSVAAYDWSVGDWIEMTSLKVHYIINNHATTL